MIKGKVQEVTIFQQFLRIMKHYDTFFLVLTKLYLNMMLYNLYSLINMPFYLLVKWK